MLSASMTHWKEAIALDPTVAAVAYERAGQLQATLGEYAGALESYRGAIASTAPTAELRRGEARALIGLRDTAGAEVSYKQALELGRDDNARATMAELEHTTIDEAPLWLRLGDLALALEDWPRAAHAFSACIENEPDATEAHYGLAVAHYGQGNEQGALHAMIATRRLDEAASPPAWERSAEQIAALANTVFGAGNFKVEALPTESDIQNGLDARTPCALDGDTWRVFHRTLDRFGPDDEELLAELRAAKDEDLDDFDD